VEDNYDEMQFSVLEIDALYSSSSTDRFGGKSQRRDATADRFTS